MHSFLTRANAVFAFSFSCLSAVTFMCFLSTQLNSQSCPDVDIQIDSVQLHAYKQFGHTRSSRKDDFGNVTFGMEADLSCLFNWNTKQLFLYVTAEYESKDNEYNCITLWDRIMVRQEEMGETPATISETVVHTKYPFFDDGKGLKGNPNVSLSLNWNIIPNAGLLPRIQSGKTYFKFPTSYT